MRRASRSNVYDSLILTSSHTEPGGWISWGEINYSNWEIVRTERGKDVPDSLTPLLEMIGTLGGTRPNWSADEYVKHATSQFVVGVGPLTTLLTLFQLADPATRILQR